MIALVVLACLGASPDVCSQTVVAWSDQRASLPCDMADSPLVADWAAAHPEMVVGRVTCLPTIRRNGVVTAMESRVLPLDACEVTSRAQAVIWQARNPGRPAALACSARTGN